MQEGSQKHITHLWDQLVERAAEVGIDLTDLERKPDTVRALYAAARILLRVEVDE